ncbi:MAG TPA: FixH family protein [Polyangiales bacterium]|nr:FixH family protein [Polyangiales bacterium]
MDLRTACSRAALLALLLAGTSCSGSSADAELGVLEAQSGPFDGDIKLDSAAPKVGDHDAELALVDGQGDRVSGAEVEITPFMPAHGHGAAKVAATEIAPGRYVAEQLSLFMPGLWELRVRVVEGDAEGRLSATFEVR